jgi:hypothetical protein
VGKVWPENKTVEKLLQFRRTLLPKGKVFFFEKRTKKLDRRASAVGSDAAKLST